jgi:hypothetical protein
MSTPKRAANTPLMTPVEAAAYLKVPVATLKAWRYRQTGPTYIRINDAHVRYRVADLDEWIDSQAVSA